MAAAMSSKDAAFLVSVMKHMTGTPTVSSISTSITLRRWPELQTPSPHTKSKSDKANIEQVDWEAVTAELGLKNVKSTRTRYGQIKSKLEASAAAAPGAGTKSPTDITDENGAAEVKTPPKRKRATTKKEAPRKAAKMVAGAAKEEPEEQEEQEDDEV